MIKVNSFPLCKRKGKIGSRETPPGFYFSFNISFSMTKKRDFCYNKACLKYDFSPYPTFHTTSPNNKENSN